MITLTLVNALVVLVALVASALVVYVLYHRDEIRIHRNVDKLNNLKGGCWYYDHSKARYCDLMTDRVVSDKDRKWL